MTKNEFLTALKTKLSSLPQNEIEKSLNYYNEIIEDSIEDGKSETEVIAALDDIPTIAERIMYNMPLPVLMKARANTSLKGISIALIILGFPIWFSLLMAFLAVLFSIYVVIWSLIIVLFSVVFSLSVAGIVGIATAILSTTSTAKVLLLIGTSLICFGAAILSFFGTLEASKGLIKLTTIVAKKAKSLFIRKEVA